MSRMRTTTPPMAIPTMGPVPSLELEDLSVEVAAITEAVGVLVGKTVSVVSGRVTVNILPG